MGETYGRTWFFRNVPEETWRLARIAMGASSFDDLRTWMFNATEEQARRQLGEEGYQTAKKMIEQEMEAGKH